MPGILAGLAALVILTFFWSLFGELGAHLVGRMAVTDFGTLWVAVGFAYLVLLRELNHGMALTILVLACTMAQRYLCLFRGPGHRPAPDGAADLAQEVGRRCYRGIGGLGGGRASRQDSTHPGSRRGTRSYLGLAIGIVGQWGDLFESAVKRDFRVKDSGRSWRGTEAFLTGSIPCFSQASSPTGRR